MRKMIKHITVVGDGGWGTTLAVHLCKKHYQVTLWGPFAAYLGSMRKSRYNPKFLPGIRLPNSLLLEGNLKKALLDSELIVFAVPSQYAAAVLKKVKRTNVNLSKKIFLSVTKGLDTKRLLRISEIISQELGKMELAVLSGPTIAMEVAKGVPTTAVIASPSLKTAKHLQHIFNSSNFRIYTNTDVAGVEIGGSIKNIIALACGVCDGLGFGTNTKAAILTRGLAEMARLGSAMGAKAKTFVGLSGLGDLVTTCFNPKSRNRSVGELLGKGKSIREILKGMEMVAEGVETVKAAYSLSLRHNIPMPITHEIYHIIYRHKNPLKAVSDLMQRKPKSE